MRLSARGIAKSFGATRALSDVALEVAPGSIHAVLGENGAGKSTLMRILAGAMQPDEGQMLLEGKAYSPRDPLSARGLGVAIVYQELSVCTHLTVAENIVLGVEPSRWGWLSRREMRTRAERALTWVVPSRSRIGPDTLLADLAPSDRQLVEIARALCAESTKLLILDEPTSTLSGDATERLFAALARLRERGLSILYISHFLEEVRRIADEYTVLRDGRTVARGRIAEVTNRDLVSAMAGQAIAERVREARPKGRVLLRLEELAGTALPVSASLELHAGQVLGIAGLVGSGRTELLRAIFGLAPVLRGEITVGAWPGAASPAVRLQQSVGLLSEDRKLEGLALELSIRENLTLSRLAPTQKHGLLSRAEERKICSAWIERLGVRCRGPDQSIQELSGGNQQKIALARLLYHDVDVLLLDEPTRGIDVRSRAEIHGWIDELSSRGKGILMVSSQLPELFSVCDDLCVMHRGQLGPVRPIRSLTEAGVLQEATGA
ncbi:MAG TPA: sugar ABC transporter ATP-binding protein [Polyangiaceae bacterium]|nr:sugar ABC transporter ATP-binding protein [Polyangiaceae bacterium]